MTSRRDRTKQARDLDIVGLGEAMVEFCAVPDASEPLYVQGFGGDTSNAIIAAARQEARAGYLTAVGDDAFGDALREFWRREGIDVTGVRRFSGAFTAAYFVTYDGDGHRFSYLRRGSAASRMDPDDLATDVIDRARILHLSGLSQAISETACDAVFRAIEIARSAGALVSYDTNLRLALWPLERARAIIHQAIRSADIALPSLDDAVKLTGLEEPEAILDHYLSLGPGLVALKMGSQGVYVCDGTDRRRIDPLPVEAIDATGAGDTFDGAFLAEYLRSSDAVAAARYANAAAALSTTRQGAAASIPVRRDVEAFLAKCAEGS